MSVGRLELQQATGIPSPPMQSIAAATASSIAQSTSVRRALPTDWTDRPPARCSSRNGIAMTHMHLKAGLGGIDGGHALPESRAVTFPHLLHQIHPGVDHFVTERAFCGALRQWLQHWSRENNFAAEIPCNTRAAPVATSGAAHPAIAPAQGHQGKIRAPAHQGTFEVFTVEPVEQRQQRQQRQRRTSCS